MKVVGIYSFKGGQDAIRSQYAAELENALVAIRSVNSADHLTKVSREKTMLNRNLYSPRGLNRAFGAQFTARDWKNRRVICEYPTAYYVETYTPPPSKRKPIPFREMDFVKNRVGVEVQFGKYAFMVYNAAAKMTIFSQSWHHRCRHRDCSGESLR